MGNSWSIGVGSHVKRKLHLEPQSMLIVNHYFSSPAVIFGFALAHFWCHVCPHIYLRTQSITRPRERGRCLIVPPLLSQHIVTEGMQRDCQNKSALDSKCLIDALFWRASGQQSTSNNISIVHTCRAPSCLCGKLSTNSELAFWAPASGGRAYRMSRSRRTRSKLCLRPLLGSSFLKDKPRAAWRDTTSN